MKVLTGHRMPRFGQTDQSIYLARNAIFDALGAGRGRIVGIASIAATAGLRGGMLSIACAAGLRAPSSTTMPSPLGQTVQSLATA
jgi:hypothetical protein